MIESIKRYKIKHHHIILAIAVLALNFIGILLIGSAKADVQTKQIYGAVLGFVVMLVVALIDYTYVLKLAWVIYGVMIVLLAWVKIAGNDSHGSTRWIKIAGIQFQPSELAKILIILFFAFFFAKFHEQLNTVKIILISLVLVAVPLGLIVSQPDLSTTIMTGLIFVTLLYIAGLSYKIILTFLGITVPIGIVGFIYLVQHADAILASDSSIAYQVGRIMSWVDHDKYPERWIQQRNSIMAIGSGQLFGKGLNNSVATSLKNSNYIQEPQTDFIFSVAGEELGFVGTMAIILLLLIIVFECIMIARKSKDLSGRLICCGMAALVAFQSIINICVAVGLLPNTGIPLPFVSYGLTSLVSLYFGMGFVLNVGLQPTNTNRGGFS